MSRAAKVEPGWKYLGGSSRRYVNLQTGEEKSREGYDKVYGSLARRGATSFKRASAAVPIEVRATRPARGRAGKSRAAGGAKAFRGLRPLAGKEGRNVSIPFDVYYPGNEVEDLDAAAEDFAEQAEPYRAGYNETVENILHNSKIGNASLIIEWVDNGGARGYATIFNLFRAKPSTAEDKLEGYNQLPGQTDFPDYDSVVDRILSKTSSSTKGTTYGPLIVHVRFFQKHLFKSKHPKRKGLKIRGPKK